MPWGTKNDAITNSFRQTLLGGIQAYGNIEAGRMAGEMQQKQAGAVQQILGEYTKQTAESDSQLQGYQALNTAVSRLSQYGDRGVKAATLLSSLFKAMPDTEWQTETTAEGGPKLYETSGVKFLKSVGVYAGSGKPEPNAVKFTEVGQSLNRAGGSANMKQYGDLFSYTDVSNPDNPTGVDITGMTPTAVQGVRSHYEGLVGSTKKQIAASAITLSKFQTNPFVDMSTPDSQAALGAIRSNQEDLQRTLRTAQSHLNIIKNANQVAKRNAIQKTGGNFTGPVKGGGIPGFNPPSRSKKK